MFSKKTIFNVFSVLFVMAFLWTLADPAYAVSASSLAPSARVRSAQDAQSTTGPIPPPESFVADSTEYIAGSSAKVLAGMPAYLWRHGCGPTAAGMVVGYWDSHGYGWLVNGSAGTQTSAVDEAIASSLGIKSNYSDYVLPMDDSSPNMLADKSEPPFGDEHADNSIADFMNTSQSYYYNRYGWSWFSDVKPAFVGYVALASSGKFQASSTQGYWDNGTFNWNILKAQIDAGHPMVLLVDSNGDGQTDHFIPTFGYDDSTGVQKYAAYNTWDSNLHWYDFRPMTNGIPWGIFGGVTISISRRLSARTFNSVGAQDGWILESSEISSKGGTLNSADATFNLGDAAVKRQYRGILSFSTGSLPDNAVITGVRLKVRQQTILGGGNPVTTFGGFMADIKNGFFGATPALQVSDFQAAASAAYGPFVIAPVGGWYNINLSGAKASINKGTAGSGLTQLRLRFKLDDNNNAVANYLSLFSGNTATAANRPQLVITYYVP